MDDATDFQPFPKIGRLSRGMTITEKLDGTNAQINITPHADGNFDADALYRRLGDRMFQIQAGSRNRWITPEADNFGFARWVWDNADELVKLGEGRHFGEWWGQGIQRRYGLQEKRFSLFNVNRWRDGRAERPGCCGVVPVVYEGEFSGLHIDAAMARLREVGSVAAPGFMNPEGIIVLHHATRTMFKKTFEKDAEGKGN